jgi:hypothetical protein
MSSPTQRTLELMRERGYLAAVVERWNPYMRRDEHGVSHGGRQDLFGFIDVLALNDSGIVAVQSTSRGCLTDHIRKIEGEEIAKKVAAVRRAGIRIVLHGWFKQRGRWHVKEIDVS